MLACVPACVAVVRSSVVVKDNGVPIKNINELEVVNGQIWANIWLVRRTMRVIQLSADTSV